MIYVCFGSEIKINVNISPIGGLHMDNYDFSCVFYTSSKGEYSYIDIPKSSMKKIDSDNYVACLNTSNIGVGELRNKVTAYIPDGDFEDGFRTEISDVYTGIIIIKK